MSELSATKMTSAKMGSLDDAGVVDDDGKFTGSCCCCCLDKRDLRSRFTDLTGSVLFSE